MVTHKLARTVLALLGCNWVVLDAVFVHWPLVVSHTNCWLDGRLHCLFAPAHKDDDLEAWYQQGMAHRKGLPSRTIQFPSGVWQEWLEENQVVRPNNYINQPDAL